jgi:heptosyltransferase-2
MQVLAPVFLRPLWAACPWVDGVISMANKRIGAQEIAQVKALELGVGLLFPNSFGSALDLWKCSLPLRIGRGGRLRSFLLTHAQRPWPRGENVGRCHQLSYYLELVAALGPVRLDSACPHLQVKPELATALGISGSDWLALAPGAAYGPAKQWPMASFREVARWQAARGGRVVLLGTGKEAAVAAAVAEAVPGAVNLAGKTSLAELMAVLAACSAAVANDSGAMHLAAALGTPGVGIFGSTDPIGTGPLGAPWQLVLAAVPCRPCFRRECPLSAVEEQYRCLHSITPTEVIGALEDVLAKRNA